MRLGHPVINDFVSIIGGQTNKMRILWPVIIVYVLIASHHVDDFADPRFLGGI